MGSCAEPNHSRIVNRRGPCATGVLTIVATLLVAGCGTLPVEQIDAASNYVLADGEVAVFGHVLFQTDERDISGDRWIELRLRHRESGQWRDIDLGPDGRFFVIVPAGAYEVERLEAATACSIAPALAFHAETPGTTYYVGTLRAAFSTATILWVRHIDHVYGASTRDDRAADVDVFVERLGSPIVSAAVTALAEPIAGESPLSLGCGDSGGGSILAIPFLLL